MFRADAVPWREKDALRTATALPKRLIDSIMAQGNWNILFQDGPFAEFQRQSAIASHFALRGEVSQAEIYFRRAKNALDIAYASLRSRFDWPRSAAELSAAVLPWGENRETFRDYLLCRLQLYIESGLAAHDLGVVKLDRLQELAAQTEKQSGIGIAQKDADLAEFIRLLRQSLNLRAQSESSPGLRAQRFLELASEERPSARNYWRRRSLFFQIQEHLQYGNLAMARALTDFLFARHGDELDHLLLARLYTQASDFAAAQRILDKALHRPEMQTGENYPDLIRTSELLQNVLVWQKEYRKAAEIARISGEQLNGLIETGLVPREEFVAIRRSAANQKLRAEMLDYLATGICPARPKPAESTEPETEWRIRERFFYEKCGMPRQDDQWQAWLADGNVTAEAKQIIRFGLGLSLIPLGKTPSANSALLRFAALYPARPAKTGSVKARISALQTLDLAGKIHADLVLLDWGITVPGDIADRIIPDLKDNLSSSEASAFFAALHRAYMRHHLRGKAVLHFAPTDAAILRSEIHDWILGGNHEQSENPPGSFDGELFYADEVRALYYTPETGKVLVSPANDWPNLTGINRAKVPARVRKLHLFGRAALLTPQAQAEGTLMQVAPLFGTCTDCAVTGRIPPRLLFGNLRQNDWKSTRADLSDIFSVQLSLAEKAECNFHRDTFLDTVITPPDEQWIEYPCRLMLENLILELPPEANNNLLGWLVAAAGRPGCASVLLPRSMNVAQRTAFLFDFLQRRNRREVSARQTFEEARRRAEKSFPAGSGIEQVKIYAAPD